jgi:restriction system protein
VELGGQGKTTEIYPLVTKKFPEITDDELAEVILNGESKWINRIRWVRQNLAAKGELDSPSRGIWAITAKGRRRVETKEPTETIVNFFDLYEKYETSFRSQLLDKLHELTPRQFELFARKLLQAYGFVKVKVQTCLQMEALMGMGNFD